LYKMHSLRSDNFGFEYIVPLLKSKKRDYSRVF
jgi:hypothetical protein